MVVVLGHEAMRVGQALGARPYESVHVDPAAQMYDSLRAGLNRAQRIDLLADFLIQPADHPEVAPATLKSLLREAAAHPGRAVMPEHAGQGGHPVLIPAQLVGCLLQHEGPGGLRQYWVDHPQDCLRLPVDDRSVTRDIDTPEDYQRGRKGFR